jgi:hypothetical protein
MFYYKGSRGGSEAAAGKGLYIISYIFIYYNNFDREGPRGADLYIL